jgi:hypothetical protein
VAQRQADKRSLGFQFKQQLMELVKLIESGKAHYVRRAGPAPVPAAEAARRHSHAPFHPPQYSGQQGYLGIALQTAPACERCIRVHIDDKWPYSTKLNGT